jgi:hypothetical protein
MALSSADVVEARRRLADPPPDHHPVDMSALQSVEEVIAFSIACLRAEGENEVELIELLVRAIDLDPKEVRRIEYVLRPLGYTSVSDMLRQIAGRRKNTLAPLSV